MPSHLLNSEGSQCAHVGEELCVGAWKGPQETGEHLIGLWEKAAVLIRTEGQVDGVLWKRHLEKGGQRGVPSTYLAPRGADAQQDATSCPDHSLKLLVLVRETKAEGEGTDNIGGGLGQQQGGVKWLSWVGKG